ncbi:MAG: hypothetical protein COB85_00150 [Bacteroidetes bacterium]|nr:MAG: hypothetical protein COB85_00150 [Bacteroidota bacterium]
MVSPRQIASIILVIHFTLSACTVDEPTEIVDDFRTINIADSLGLNSGDAKIFLLPAPLQIVSALHIQSIPYQPELIRNVPKDLTGNKEYRIALNLGINTIDLGYSTVYGDYQMAINYATNVKELMEILGIRSALKSPLIKRFEENASNVDSLSSIILEAYSASHEYFQLNEREGVGLLILTGCFIEGLYLATGVNQAVENRQVHGLIALHKEYSANILLLLSFYRNNADVANLLDKLEALVIELEDINYDYNSSSGKAVLDKPISTGRLLKIKATILDIRRSVRI